MIKFKLEQVLARLTAIAKQDIWLVCQGRELLVADAEKFTF